MINPKTVKNIIQIYRNLGAGKGVTEKKTLIPIITQTTRGLERRRGGVYIENINVKTSSLAKVANTMLRGSLDLAKVPKTWGIMNMEPFWSTGAKAEITVAPGAAGAVPMEALLAGLLKLEAILKDEKGLTDIAAAAFQTHISPVLMQRWQTAMDRFLNNKGAPEWPYAGAGIRGKDAKGLTEADSTLRKQGMDEGSVGGRYPAPILGQGGFTIGAKALLHKFGEVRKYGKGYVGLPPYTEFLSITVPARGSPFRSIFMIIEFGTGAYAVQGYKRGFSGYDATPYKVPSKMQRYPNFAAGPTWWFGRADVAAKARLFLQDIGNQSIGAFEKEATTFEERAKAKYRSNFDDIPPRYRYLAFLRNNWFFNFMVKGSKGQFSIFKRNTTNVVGSYPEIRKAIQNSFDAILAHINALIREEVPTWPGLGVTKGTAIHGKAKKALVGAAESVGLTWNKAQLQRIKLYFGVLQSNTAKRK